MCTSDICAQPAEPASTLTSPDGVLQVSIDTHDGSNLSYSIYEGRLGEGNIYALHNAIGLQIEGMKGVDEIGRAHV